MELLVLSEAEVRQCISMKQAIDLMEVAFASLSEGGVESPLRTAITNDEGTILYKPAYWSAKQLFCCKIVSVFKGNAKNDQPVTAGLIQVNDATNGLPIAMMDANYITSLRTGAATGLATRLLANDDAKTAALFGTGGQARHQLEAMLAVRDFSRVYVFSGRTENAARFCDSNQELSDSCELIPESDLSVLADCQVVTTATTNPEPLFQLAQVAPGTHISAVGSLGKNRREISTDIVLGSQVVVDHRDACLAEAGELCIVESEGKLPDGFRPVELGELLNGTQSANKNELTLFKSVGNAAQDIVCVDHVLNEAKRLGLGARTSL